MRIALLLLTLVAAAPAAADNNEIVFGSFSRSLRSDSANAVTGENLGGPQLGYARRIGIDLVPKLQLWATANYAVSSVAGMTFDMETEVTTHVLTLGGRARYILHPNLGFVVRLDVGSNHTSLSLTDDDKTVSDGGWGGVATASLGVEAFAYASRRFALGFRAEYGYTMATAIELAPAAPKSEDMIELDAMQASIGHLDLGGRFFAISLLSRF